MSAAIAGGLGPGLVVGDWVVASAVRNGDRVTATLLIPAALSILRGIRSKKKP